MRMISLDANFWLPHTDGKEVFEPARPAVFASSLVAMREVLHWCKRASADEQWEGIDPDKCTWHSARCTVPSWAGEAGRSSVEILMQMHSSSPDMAAKYQRERGTIASRMVTELCADLQRRYKKDAQDSDVTGEAIQPAAGGAEPALLAAATSASATPPAAGAKRPRSPSPSSSDSSSSSSSEDEDIAVLSTELETPLAFYVKHTVKTGPVDKVRYHCPALSNPTVLACGAGCWHDTATFECAGAQPPKGAQVCKRCVSVRPDVAAKVGRWQREDRSIASSSGLVRPQAKSKGAVLPVPRLSP